MTGTGTRLKNLKDEVGSMAGLVRWLRVSKPTLLTWFAGSAPSESALRKICRATGLDYNWLKDGIGDASEAIRLAQSQRIGDTPRMFLKLARLQAGLTLKQLAAATGYRADVLRAVEEGEGRASERMIDALCKALPLEKETLMSGSDSPTIVQEAGGHGTYGAKPNIQMPEGKRARYVPLLSWAQAGNMDAGFVDQAYSYEGVLSIDVKDPNAFGISIRGNSMEPRIVEGDDVIVCPGMSLRAEDVVIALTTKGDVMCKIYQPKNGGELVVLSSYNPAYPPIERLRSEFAWIYPVVQVVQNLRRE